MSKQYWLVSPYVISKCHPVLICKMEDEDVGQSHSDLEGADVDLAHGSSPQPRQKKKHFPSDKIDYHKLV